MAYLGSGELTVKVRVLGAEAIAPGETGLVRLHLPVAVPLLPGDRYVLREWGRQETVGGGEVLDVAPGSARVQGAPRPLGRAGGGRAGLGRGRPAGAPDRGGPGADDRPLGGGPRRGRRGAGGARGGGGRGGPARASDLAAFDDRARAVLATLPDLAVDGGRVRRAAAADPLADHPYLARLDAEPFAPPPPDGVDRAELRELVRRGLVVAQDGVWFSAGAVERAGRLVADLLAAHPEGVTMSDLRVVFGNTRRHALPLVAVLDGQGVTRRRGDLRVAGPRLPARDVPEAGR